MSRRSEQKLAQAKHEWEQKWAAAERERKYAEMMHEKYNVISREEPGRWHCLVCGSYVKEYMAVVHAAGHERLKKLTQKVDLLSEKMMRIEMMNLARAVETSLSQVTETKSTPNPTTTPHQPPPGTGDTSASETPKTNKYGFTEYDSAKQPRRNAVCNSSFDCVLREGHTGWHRGAFPGVSDE